MTVPIAPSPYWGSAVVQSMAGASAELTLNGGSYGYLRGEAYLSGGNDRIAGNLAVSLSRNGGYGTNRFTGRSDEGAIDHSFVGGAN